MNENKIIHWTDEENKFLIKYYQMQGPKWCSENIGTNRTKSAISFHAINVLNLKKNPAWSENDIKLLKENYAKKPIKEIVFILKKSTNSIYQMAAKLNINCVNYQYWTDKEIELLKINYNNKLKKELLLIFNNRSWLDIKTKANDLGLKKNTKGMDKIYADLSILLNNSSETAYWLGFLLADGHFSKNNRLALTLATLDKKHVVEFGEYIKFIGKYRETKINFSLAIMDGYNVKLIKNKYNIDNCKTYNPPKIDIFKNMSDDFFLSLLIGFIDGDGTIRDRKDTKTKFIGIKCHSSWLNNLNYFIERLEKIVGINLTKGYINNSGYAQIYITNNIHIKFLKRKTIEFNLPILHRKWDGIDLDFYSREELHPILKEKTKQFILKNNLNAKQIANKMNLKIERIYKYIRELKKEGALIL